MSIEDSRTYQDSIQIAAEPDAVYDLVSDVTRVGEWSPVCRGCDWDEGASGRVGDGFTGHNVDGDRRWDTHSEVIVAERGRAFGWEVNGGLVAWRFDLEAQDGGTRLTESWEFRAAGLRFFGERFGDEADAQIDKRTRDAQSGIPASLAAVKRIAEGAAS